MSDRRDDQFRHYETAPWFLLALLAYSYPFLALFARDDDTSGLSLIVLPAIVGLCIAGVIGFFSGNIRNNLAIISASLIFFIFNIVTYYTDSSMLLSKFIQFNFVLVLFGVVTAYSFRVPALVVNIDRALVVIGVLALAALALGGGEYDIGRVTYADSNPIWMGRILGFAAIGAVSLGLRRQNLLVPLGMLTVLLMAGIVVTGSRGPLLSVILAVAIAVALFRFENKSLLISIGAVAVVASLPIIALYANGLDLRAFSLGGADDVSYYIRVTMFDYTIGVIEVTPGGIGIGNFQYYGFPYPHNIFLEFLIEWGWAYGAMMILATALGGLGLFLAGSASRLFIMLYIFEVTNASVSGDITSPRFLYGLIIFGLALLFARGMALFDRLTHAAFVHPLHRAPDHDPRR